MERPDGNYAGTEYLMIPQEYVLDGINIVNNDASSAPYVCAPRLTPAR